MLLKHEKERIISSKELVLRYLLATKNSDSFVDFDMKIHSLDNGEYNYNYILDFDINLGTKRIKDLAVLRINYGSQMNLDNQLEYEYSILEYLKDSGVTPKPILLDTSKTLIERDYLLMEFINGEWLDYNNDTELGLKSLSKIHSYNYIDRLENTEFIISKNPVKEILKESKTLYTKYINSEYFNTKIDEKMKIIFDKVAEICNKTSDSDDFSDYVLINTELNSSNFLINDKKCFVVDWEKAIWGKREQDLGHFLAPTTTFWKTDIVFDHDICDKYIRFYYDYSDLENIEYDKFHNSVIDYIRLNCLRGLSWCFMAYVDYTRSTKEVMNEFTAKKLDDYTSVEFIDMIIDNYFKE